MWQLLKMVFLGGTTLLTPTPIEIGTEWVSLTPKKPLTAITSGATLYFDVTQALPSSINLVERLEQGERLFPDGCAQAQLVTGAGQVVPLGRTGVAVSNTKTFLVLSADKGVPTDAEFFTVRVRADCRVGHTPVYWKNFSK